MREPILTTAYVNGTVVSGTVRCSIRFYVAEKQSGTDTALTAPVKAILRYGDS